MSDVTFDNEIWRDVRGYEGLYQVSNQGRVRSLDRVLTYKNGAKHNYKGKVLKPVLNNMGYETVSFGRKRHQFIHRLVAGAFIPNPNNLPFINHKDENPRNNFPDNLEWCTQAYNLWYGSNSERNSYKRKPIIQLSLEGQFIKRYDSIKHAAKELGAKACSIGNAVRGFHHTSCGYKWIYANE